MTDIDGRTRLMGLLGHPVEHTLSPAMFNAAFEVLKLNYCYVPLPVAPKDLAAAVHGLAALGFVGANVTIPHKQAVMSLLDEVSEEAEDIGAVNTIEFKAGKRIGYNTDCSGFLAPLTEQGISVQGFQSLVLGAGGAARSVVYSLLKAGSSVTVLNRTEDRSAALVDSLMPHTGGLALRSGPLNAAAVEAFAFQSDLVVNTTSLGMSPHEDTSPWPEDFPFPSKAIAYDLVYAPPNTAFLERAELAGAQTIGGLRMLIHQGAVAFETWTGRSAPLDIMSSAIAKGHT